MEPMNRKIQALVDMFLNQELLLPEMQRKYVWRTTQVRDLIDSIYRDYPSGSILVWETDTLPQVKPLALSGKSQPALAQRLLLLDGQQRITSLAAVLTGRPIRIKEGKSVKERKIDLYFNVDHPEERRPEQARAPRIGDAVEAKGSDDEFLPAQIVLIEKGRYYVNFINGEEGWTDDIRDLDAARSKDLFFQVRNRGIENKPSWISVTHLFREGVGAVLRSLKIGADDPNFDKYNARLNQLYLRKEGYLYPIQVIRDKDYREVTEIFVRVNSSGTRLVGTDLALAQITCVWPGSMKIFEEFAEACAERDFYLNEGFLVRCLVAVATGQGRFDRTGRLSTEDLQDAWKKTRVGVEKVVNFLRNNAYVDSSALLPSPTLLVPLVHFASSRDLSESEDSRKGFLRWFYTAATWGRYSRSAESNLDQDLTALRQQNPWMVLLENVWQFAGKNRTVTIDDVRGKGVNNPLFFMMYVVARAGKARDLETGEVINYANFGKNNEIEYDHIFPKSKLEPHLKDAGDLEKQDRKRLINEIANMAFLTKKGNLIKRNEDPASYFPKVMKKRGPDVFDWQQIPYTDALLTYDAYESFLDKRAGLISAAINRMLNSVE